MNRQEVGCCSQSSLMSILNHECQAYACMVIVTFLTEESLSGGSPEGISSCPACLPCAISMGSAAFQGRSMLVS